jgi:NADH dehydrogenase
MENTKPVMVVGATGFLGTEICRQLTSANKKVKALVRGTSDLARVKALENMGIEIVTGDIKDVSALGNAFAGVGAVISTASSTRSRNEDDLIETVDRQGQLNVVEAAETNSVEHIIYISFLESPETFPLQDAKREVEKRIQKSKMKYTILRPPFLWSMVKPSFRI